MPRKEGYIKITKKKTVPSIKEELDVILENLEQKELIEVNYDYKNIFNIFSPMEILTDIHNNRENFDGDQIVDDSLRELFFYALIRREEEKIIQKRKWGKLNNYKLDKNYDEWYELNRNNLFHNFKALCVSKNDEIENLS